MAIGLFATGGGMYSVNSSPEVTNCTFSGNTSHFDGDGIVGASDLLTNWGMCPRLNNDGHGWSV